MREVDELSISDSRFDESVKIVVRGYVAEGRFARLKAAWRVFRGRPICRPVNIVGNSFATDAAISREGIKSVPA